jgi:acyl-CoA reductase-like NAD-dependent aldehyde dehydrogenase
LGGLAAGSPLGHAVSLLDEKERTMSVRCVSPVNGELYAERPYAEPTEIAQVFASARAAQRDWATTSVGDRAALVSRAVDAMLAMREAIAPELSWQMGRPVQCAGNELGGFEERARYMIDLAASALEPLDPGPKAGFTRFVRREPLGTVFVVAPWNYPYLTAVNAIVPALMAGNAVVLKHAAQTLLVAERFQQALDLAGLPEGLFQHLFLSHEQTAGILSSRQADFVNFTGSVAAGRDIERAAAGTFMGVGLELGGKDPAYVLPDADLDYAIENLADGSFFNSGQCCCGIERIYVHSDVYPQFVEGIAELTRSYVLGDPTDAVTTLGPMARARDAAFVRGEIDAAVAAGAQALVDESLFPASEPGTAYLAPQVLIDVDHSMSIMREETFGPVVGIMPVRDDRQAIELMNDSRFGLTAGVWTRDEERALRIGAQIETGTLFMNRCDYLDPALAWTGVKETGRGATLSRIGYETLTRPKSFHFRHPGEG